MEPGHIIERIREDLIGQYQPMETPFGTRPMVYADYTASGRGLRWIEDKIQHEVLPYYANTHSESSLCGAQTTALREQARATIANALGCGEQDRVIFCGSGATAAINRLIELLGLRRSTRGERTLAEDLRPVVFVGPYEHHSNELPWRESIADIVRIPLDSRGQIDKQALSEELERYVRRPLRIGSFSAGSNVTGVLSDVQGITKLLKAAGALAFWDYAAAGPYVAIDMNTAGAPIDAVFLSPHKFVGGPGTPGVLVLKADLVQRSVPAMIGGGTVSWVSANSHHYLTDIERREEGGTPAIVESIRAGLAMGLREAVGTDEIARREQRLLDRVTEHLDSCESIEILGPRDVERLSILSLRFHHGERELHYGFVVALLNDLFGIQARGGCSCAGPYGHELLAIDNERSQALEHAASNGHGVLRPGWVRLNLNYFIDDCEADYLAAALRLIGEHGWRLLPAYRYDAATGCWVHRDYQRRLPVALDTLAMVAAPSTDAQPQPGFEALLKEAKAILETGADESQRRAASLDEGMGAEQELLRWYVTPVEVAGFIGTQRVA